MYIDTDIFMALIKPRDRHLSFAQEIVKQKTNLYTSAATLAELEIVTKREIGDFVSQNILEIVMQKIPGIKIIPLDKKIIQKSLELRKKFGVTIYDSIHAATAIHKDKKIISTDHIYDKITELERIKPGQSHTDSAN